MNILSSFLHPQVLPKLYEFLSSAEHKGILKNVDNPIDLYSIFFPILWKSVGPVNCLVTCILKNIFCHTHLEQLKGKVNNIRIFIFEFSQMNYTKHILLWRWIVYLY